MRRFVILFAFAFLMTPMLAETADAQRGFRGGGGFARPAFAGGGFRAGGFARPAFAGAGFRGGLVRPGFGRPAFAGAGFVRPGFAGAGVRWAGGHRAGWRWRGAGVGFALGALAAAPYYGAYGYGYGPYYDDCAPVARQVWTGWGYQVVWVNSCEYYY